MTNVTFAIVLSLATAQEPAWAEVADALAVKHADAAVVRIASEGSVTNALSELREAQPTHVAFVMRPEEVDFPTLLALKRQMRDLDADPYDDAKWGVVTGPTAEAAQRIASSREPKVVRTALATTGISDDFVSGEFCCLSDANPPGCWRVKGADGTVADHSSSNDLSRVFAEAWNTIDPEMILTSSHASERNLEMPFSRGNIVPKDGAFWTAPDLSLIDYATGQAKTGGAVVVGEKLQEPKREKIWLAAGNCLIANKPSEGENMVMTALGFGKVNQFVGYTATTWFGEIGWGTLSNFAKGMSLVDAYFAASEQVIRELEGMVTNANDFRPLFSSASDYNRLLGEARKFPFVPFGPVALDAKTFIGRLWDRDATIFYGDPLHNVYLKPPHD